MIDLIYALVVLLALIPAVGYVVRYQVVTRGAWRKKVVGRAMMHKAIVNALLLAFIGFNLTYMQIVGHSYWLRPYIGLGLFIAFAVVLWRLWFAFEKIQKSERK